MRSSGTPDCYEVNGNTIYAVVLPTTNFMGIVTKDGSRWEVQKKEFQPGRAYPFRTEDGIVMRVPIRNGRRIFSIFAFASGVYYGIAHQR
jgi:hypothetical protein